ncbi:MAG: lanthionine synthetase LanC family protein [Cyclobacteriaceae bacterium]|nr:lanthionine synthetase LanC family protein [Cyclobacteriaceae bacterium]
MNDKIKIIIELLEKHISKLENQGLLHGKMGISLFLFHLGKKTSNSAYTALAEKIVEQVYEDVEKANIAPDFENGLAGIAWGLEHVIQNGFFDGDRDSILSDLDDKIFQYITKKDELSIRLQDGLLGYGVYLFSRIQGKALNQLNDHNYLLKRLLIEVINRMYDQYEEKEELS